MRDAVTRRGRQAVINARVSEDTRHSLKRAAEYSGRSMSDELERRLRLTFVDEHVGSLDDVARALAACLAALQKLRSNSPETHSRELVAPHAAAEGNGPSMRKEAVRGKRAVLNALVSHETRSWLKQAADQSGRSMAEELERRLRLTFVDDQIAGVDDIERALSACISTLQKRKPTSSSSAGS